MTGVSIVPWESGAPRGCRMPGPMRADEAAIYQKLRSFHCAQKLAGHDCSGRVTLDRNGVNLQCPLCGDARSIYPKGKAE